MTILLRKVSKSFFILLFSLMKKVTKKSRTNANSNLFGAHSASTPKKIGSVLPGSSLKMFAKHFLTLSPAPFVHVPALFH
jgi:hypothetical protein